MMAPVASTGCTYHLYRSKTCVVIHGYVYRVFLVVLYRNRQPDALVSPYKTSAIIFPALVIDC
jgi:hypothetical protein